MKFSTNVGSSEGGAATWVPSTPTRWFNILFHIIGVTLNSFLGLEPVGPQAEKSV